MGDGLGGVGQGEGLRHVRLDLAVGVHLQELGDALLVLLGVRAHPGAPEHADDLTALKQGQVQRNGGDTGREPDDQEAAFPSHRAQAGLGIVAADRVINDIDAIGATGFLKEVGQSLLAVLIERAGGIDHAAVGAA